MGGARKPKEDLTGMTFNEWKVLEYVGGSKWECECTCGTKRVIQGTHLKIGRTKNCGHNATNKKIDLTGKTFGDWEVLYQAPPGNNGETRWQCRCSCGAEKVVTSYALRNGTSTSCGHNTTGFNDITGKTFNEWKVLSRADGKTTCGSTKWVCQCSCGTIAEVGYYELKSGSSKSCGCKANEVRSQTLLDKYGVKYAAQIGTKRTQEQLDTIESAEKLSNFIKENFDYTPSIPELAVELELNRWTVVNHLNNYGLNHLVKHGKPRVSSFEYVIQELFPCSNMSDRKVLNGKEIDLYYPDLKLGIEFNGNYWHNDSRNSDINYHQNKSIEARNKGIRLFHIFEYEWTNKTKQAIIKDMLSSIYYGDRVNKIMARDCELREIDNKEAEEFLNRTHIQGYAPAKVNLGLYKDNKLVSIMTFGTPRFNSNYEWELIRLATELSTFVVGGASKMFKYFIKNYNSNSIISYCNLSKFNGKIYELLNFELDGITDPSYIWINLQTYDVMTRYQTEKHRLLELGLGDISESESDIMTRLGYNKIYDCGNLRFIWTRDK